MRFTASTAIAALILAAVACRERPQPNMTYPATAKGDVVDDYFGTKVPDPYRWMEDLDSPAVADWVAAQNRVTVDYLEKLPMRARFKQRITELWDYPKVGVPVREGGRYFYTRNSGLQRQAPLYRSRQPYVGAFARPRSERPVSGRHPVAAAVDAVARRKALGVRNVGRRRRLADDSRA